MTVAFESAMGGRLCAAPWTRSREERAVQYVVVHDKELKEDKPPVYVLPQRTEGRV